MWSVEDVTGLTGSWLAARWGTQPALIEARRRSGELVGLRRPAGEVVYPGWQFGPDGKPLEGLPRIIAAARREGIDDARLNELLTMRAGLTRDRRLADVLRDGDVEGVVRSLRLERA